MLTELLTELFLFLYPIEDTRGMLIRLFIAIVLYIVAMHFYIKTFKDV